MKIEDGLAVIIPEGAGMPVQSRFKPRTEITIDDLKLLPEQRKALEETKEPHYEDLESVVENANKVLDISGYYLKFRVDEKSNRVQVKLIDNTTQEVIREIPAEKMLELSAHIKEVLESVNVLVGVFVDEVG